MKFNRFNHVWRIREETNDENIIHGVFNIKMYDLSLLKKPVKTCLNIGAHIGAFTVKIKQAFPQCKVWAFEPISEDFNLLSLNTSAFTGVNVSQSTISGDRLPGNLVSSNATNTGSNIFTYGNESIPIYRNTHIKDVQDTIKYIDLLKINCEGGENSIFENINFRKIGSIMAELHQYGATKTFEQMFLDLEKAGFKTLYKNVVNSSVAEYVGTK